MPGEPYCSSPPEEVAIFMTQRAGIAGTLPFISPEMAKGDWQAISTASDIYGLGAILNTMFTGTARGRTPKEIIDFVVEGRIDPPRKINSGVDRLLEAICLKRLEKEPKDRYGSADALANDLRRWLDLKPPVHVPVGHIKRLALGASPSWSALSRPP